MGGIFISYRRSDTAYIAGRLHDRLAAHFGPEQIFRDIETIKPGVDFGQRIDEAVGSCDAFLAIIGDGWMVDRNPEGKRPIGVARDWVQREIEVALGRPDLLVIPVLVENATMPGEQELPYSIRALGRRNAMELSDRRWDYEVGQLIEVLEEVVERRAGPAALGTGAPPAQPPPPPAWAPPAAPLPAPPASGPPEPPPRRGIPTWLKVVVPVVLLALLVIVPSVFLLGNRGEGDETTTGSSGTTDPVVATATRPTITIPTTRPGTTVPTRVINGPFSGRSGAVTLTVQKLEAGTSKVRVHLVIVNGTRNGLRFPAQGFSAVDDTGRPYRSDPFSPDWVDDVQPGSRAHSGIIDLAGPLQSGAATMRVGWSTVFGSPDVRSIFVDRVSLR